MNWLAWAGRMVTGRHAERQTSTFTEPVRRAEVRVPAGAVSFAPTDGPARVDRTVRWALARPVTAERVRDGVLRIDGSRRWWQLGGDISYRLEVPAAASVRASTRAGAVGVEGIGGDVEVQTGAGEVTLERLSGSIRAITRAGQVHATGLESADVRVESDAGGLSLTFAAPPRHVEARTKAGSVELSVPGERYAVDATSSAGRVQVGVADDPLPPRQLIAHSGAGRVWISRH